METVTMTITNQYITSITDVDAIWVVGDVLTPNTPLEMTFLIEDNYTVSLHNKKSCNLVFNSSKKQPEKQSFFTGLKFLMLR